MESAAVHGRALAEGRAVSSAPRPRPPVRVRRAGPSAPSGGRVRRAPDAVEDAAARGRAGGGDARAGHGLPGEWQRSQGQRVPREEEGRTPRLKRNRDRGMFWPFQISSREAAAVEQWLATNKTFHVMRDHPQHDTTILGGMWGARWDQLSAPRVAEELARLRQRMLERGQGKSRHGQDQEILTVSGT